MLFCSVPIVPIVRKIGTSPLHGFFSLQNMKIPSLLWASSPRVLFGFPSLRTYAHLPSLHNTFLIFPLSTRSNSPTPAL